MRYLTLILIFVISNFCSFSAGLRAVSSGTTVGQANFTNRVCIQGSTHVATHSSGWFHFFRGHYVQAVADLSRIGVHPNDKVEVSFGMKTYQYWWEFYVQSGLLQNIPAFDKDCVEAKSQGITVIQFGLTHVPDSNARKYDDYFDSCARASQVLSRMVVDHGQSDALPTLLTAGRQNGRRVTNWQEVERYFAKIPNSLTENWIRVEHVQDLGALTFAQQVSKIGRAKVYAAYHGAGISMETFMPSGSVVVEFEPSGYICLFGHCRGADSERRVAHILSTTFNRKPDPFNNPSSHLGFDWKTLIAEHGNFSDLQDFARDTDRTINVARVADALSFVIEDTKGFANRGVDIALDKWRQMHEGYAHVACQGAALLITENCPAGPCPVDPSRGMPGHQQFEANPYW
jgi:hypothetical protein